MTCGLRGGRGCPRISRELSRLPFPSTSLMAFLMFLSTSPIRHDSAKPRLKPPLSSQLPKPRATLWAPAASGPWCRQPLCVSMRHTIPAFLCTVCLPTESINRRRAGTLSLTSSCTLCTDDFSDSLHSCSPGLSKPWASPDIYLVANSWPFCCLHLRLCVVLGDLATGHRHWRSCCFSIITLFISFIPPHRWATFLKYIFLNAPYLLSLCLLVTRHTHLEATQSW